MNTPQNGLNGSLRRLGSIINSFWYLILIGGAIVTAIAWGMNLRTTVERNHNMVLKHDELLEVMKVRIANLEATLHNYVSPRELYDAIRTGTERNRVQDERITELMRRVDRLESEHPRLPLPPQ
jgi:hypothetical protein